MKEFFNEIRTVPKELIIETYTSWVEVHKSSDFPIDASKPYFCRWKIGNEEGIWWGEMDDLYMNNFVERGKISEHKKSK